MFKTKIVPKRAYMRLSEAKSYVLYIAECCLDWNILKIWYICDIFHIASNVDLQQETFSFDEIR